MPVYNGERFLREAVDSILSQTFTDFEFIIIDDGSTDDTADILRLYAQQDKRIRLHHQTNQGIVAALNTGLGMARGKYLARMDADDISLPGRFAAQVDFLEAHPDVGALGCSVQVMDRESVLSSIWRVPTEHGVLKWQTCFSCPLMHPTVMMRREVVERVGGYDPGMEHAEDYDLWRRLSGVTRLANLDDVLLHLRKHGGNVSATRSSEQRANSIRISALMIANILGEEPPAAVVQSLWERRFDKASDARAGAELVYRLYQAIAASGDLSSREKRSVRRDAAARMWNIGRPWAKDVRVWGVLARACSLDPLIPLRLAGARLRRVFPCVYGRSRGRS